MTKSRDIFFDGKPGKCPTLEEHLIKEVEKPTIGRSKDILGFQLFGHGPEINLL
jgi:hypothetical protein